MNGLEELSGKEEVALSKYHHQVVWVARLGLILGIIMGLGFPVMSWLLWTTYSGWFEKALSVTLLLSAISAGLCAAGGIGMLERRKWGLTPMKFGLIGLLIFMGILAAMGFETLEGDTEMQLPQVYSFSMLLLGLPMSMAPLGGLILMYTKEVDKYFR